MWRNSTESAVSGTQCDDLTLVHASQDGDVAAFGELVKRYDRKLFRIAHHVTQNPQDAEEVVQDAFLKAFQNLARFRGDSKFSTWLIRITLNQGLMRLRQRRVTREVSLENNPCSEDGNLPFDLADWAPNPEQLYRAAELKAILRKALRKLSPESRMVFVLRDIEGLSLEQTAEALGLSVGAVKARSWRARLQLRERLSRYFHETKGLPHAAPGSSRPAAAFLSTRGYAPASQLPVHQDRHPMD
jgi:RNA polymerase sigma-70 factor, ECF subfamily